jgi:hypothetical protein
MSMTAQLHNPTTSTVEVYGQGDEPFAVPFVAIGAPDGAGSKSTLFFRTVDDAAAWLRGTLHRLVVAEAKPCQ